MNKTKVIATAEKYIQDRKYDKAIKELQGLAIHYPQDPRLKLKIAEVYAKKKDISTAVKIYEEVAEAYTKSQFYLKAITVYKSILMLNPALVKMNEKLGELYHNVNMDGEAMRQYQIIVGYYEGHGQLKEALKIREKMLEVDPSSTTNRLRLAEIYQSDGNSEESLKQYEATAATIVGKEDESGLTEVYEKILYFKPDNSSVVLSLFRRYFKRKDFEKIITFFEKATPQVKTDDEINYLAAEAYLRLDQVHEAKKRFKELYEKMLKLKDWQKSDYLYGRIHQEFELDDDYFEKIEALRKEAGRPPAYLTESHRVDTQPNRPDLEKTGEVAVEEEEEKTNKQKKSD